MSTEIFYLKNSRMLQLKTLQLHSSPWEVSHSLCCNFNITVAFPQHGGRFHKILFDDESMVDFTLRELKLTKNVWCFALTLLLFVTRSQSTFQMLRERTSQFWKFSNISFTANFLVKCLTLLWFCSARMSLPFCSKKAKEGWNRLLQVAQEPSEHQESLHYSLALPLMQTGLQAMWNP